MDRPAFFRKEYLMHHHKRYTEEDLRNDQCFCKVLMSAVTAAIVIAIVIGIFRLTL